MSLAKSSADIPSLKDVRLHIINAISRLYRDDPELLEVDANERSITHKLAEYLQLEFPGWNVDCEYNRLGDENERKRLVIKDIERPTVEDTEAKTVFPDIIVHHRKKPENLLVMEVKKGKGEADTKDIVKLRAFTKVPKYRYHYGLFLRLEEEPKHCELRLFQNGKHRDSWKMC